jgi:ribosomal protein S18 acetylase RimI-like enzyme
MFATASLAKRIEQAECSMLRELSGAVRARLGGAADVYAESIGGGIAVFAGEGSPINKLAGLGFDATPEPAQLAAVEQAFAARNAPLQAELSSLADPPAGRLLTERGFRLVGFENVFGLPLDETFKATGSEEIEVHPSTPADARGWMDAVATGFMHPDTYDGPPSHESFSREAIENIFIDTLATPSFERFLARRGGAIAGGASLRIDRGVAQLAGAATMPEHRRRGVQSALLRQRLASAAARGCDVAVVTTSPGSKSAANVQRFGFQLLYVRAVLIKPPALE